LPVAALAWLAALLAAPAARANAVSPLHIDHPSGVRIDVVPTRPDVSDDDVLEALEDAARQIRRRRAAPPTAPPSMRATLGRPVPVETPSDCEVLVRSPGGTALPGRPDGSGEPSHGSNSLAGIILAGFLTQAGEPEGQALAGDACTEGIEWGVPGLEAVEHGPWKHTLLPGTLLWSPPWADPMTPQMYVQRTSLDNARTSRTIDTAIGATQGIWRYGPDRPYQGLQFDMFAVVFSRFGNYADDTANDFRFGLPLSWAFGNWEGKVGYEHTSTHVGDDFIRNTLHFKQLHVRDEVVFGLAYRFTDHLRVYGQFGYAPHMSAPIPGNHPDRWDCGVEWLGRNPTGCRGEPFALLDVNWRSDQHYATNTTVQVGWRWQGNENRANFRVFLEAYNGRSPFGQFFLDGERWFGGGFGVVY
jgi:hypothetical protein